MTATTPARSTVPARWNGAPGMRTSCSAVRAGRVPGGDLRYSFAASAARFSIAAKSPAANADFGVSQEPPMQPTFGSARYDGAEATVIPPVGQNASEGSGPAID